MASITNVNTAVSGAVEVPEVWANFIIEHRDAHLQAGKFFMDFSSYVNESGDKIHIPQNIIEQTPASFTEGNRLTDMLQANTEGEVTIDLDDYEVNPFVISDKLAKQSKYLAKAERYKKASYAIAKTIDTQILAHSSSFTTTAVNNGGSTLTFTDLSEAYTRLNDNNVPSEERMWFLNPWAIHDMLTLSGNYFTSMDFADEKSVIRGYQGKSLLQSPVISTTNTPSGSTGSPAINAVTNVYAHKEAIFQAYQFRPEVQESGPKDGITIDLQGQLCNVRALYGTSLGRGDHGVRVLRQS